MKRIKATAKPRSGRPPRYTKPRVPIASRLQGPLHKRLKREAEFAGRSISEEIEHRLERIFSEERSLFDVLDHMYGSENAALLTVFGELIKSIDYWAPMVALARSETPHLNAVWLDDPFLFDETVKALNDFLEALRPGGDVLPPKEYQETLRDRGKQSATAMLALISSWKPTEPPLAKSGWVAHTRAKLSQSTILKITTAIAEKDRC
jgi:hypothetical protein